MPALTFSPCDTFFPDMQDGVKVEFEDDLPFELFALRIPSAWLHRLPDILERVIESGRAKQMRHVLR